MNELSSRLNRERRFLVLLGVICLALIGGALYMQVVLGEAPCPLCILQRYALLFIAVFAFLAAAMPGKRSLTLFEALVVLSAIGGIIAAGNHVYILANPMVSCGIDTLQPIVDDLPLAKLWPLAFQVDGFCSTPYPPILGLSLAQWALIAFVLTALLVPLGSCRVNVTWMPTSWGPRGSWRRSSVSSRRWACRRGRAVMSSLGRQRRWSDRST